ncbi:hypothetical protein M2305_003266 [Gluconobacter cerinus]|uniref:hypothetical protein n=1 Tax=Gluconobacter cerinus TaxID=38307 RepID=UPI002226C8A8|nr:hypothetical protein [Gluconobacter cerinus]MCW2267247.1 hypothetical protein [Gluconobacter cerinus]
MILSTHFYKTIIEIEREDSLKLEQDMTITEHGKSLKFKGVSVLTSKVFYDVVEYSDDVYILTDKNSMFKFEQETYRFLFVNYKGNSTCHSSMKEPDIIKVCMYGQFLYEHDITGFILSVREELEDILPEYVQDITEEHEMYIMMKEIIKKPLKN